METAEKEKKIINLLSMAQRAGKIVSGAFAVEEALLKKKVVLLIAAADADSKDEWKEKAENAKIPFIELLTKDTLGHTIGKEYRAVAALTDRGFAKALRERME